MSRTSSRPELTLHLLPNAHLDPVWQWDWRDGYNEGLITCRTILDLMDEFDELTFVRGEMLIYRHIQQTDPELFRRIEGHVRTGRWDVVGGSYIQTDDNLPATESLLRQYTWGMNYFRETFGRAPRVAWSADPFGHSAGIPEILAAAGLEAFIYTRPSQPHNGPDSPLFWWASPSGRRVLVYRPTDQVYCHDRGDLLPRLQKVLAYARENNLSDAAVFVGLGNHGGGPTRRHLREIEHFRKQHADVNIEYSTFHRLLDVVRKRLQRDGDDAIPTYTGELGYCLRGCYSSMAKVKFPFRRAEAQLARTERTDALLATALKRPPANLDGPWQSILLNSFHDIVTGSSIERAFDDQIAQLGGTFFDAQAAEFHALNALAEQVDTTVSKPRGQDIPTGVPALVWNPHPQPVETFVEYEASLDYRPLTAYTNREAQLPVRLLDHRGRALPHQPIEIESIPYGAPWRWRVVAPMTLPALGYTTLEMGYVEGARAPKCPDQPVKTRGNTEIANTIWTLRTRKGAAGVTVLRNGKKLLGPGLSAAVYDDPWSAWGGMDEEPESVDISRVVETWNVADCRVFETGPWRAALWVRLAGKRSHIDLTFRLSAGRDAVDVQARVLWNEPARRLKLHLPCGDRAEFEVPGGTVHRPPAGEVFALRWVRVTGGGPGAGLACDSLYNFDCKDGTLRATVCRSPRFSDPFGCPAEATPWRGRVDIGDHRFRFILTPPTADLSAEADLLEQPPVVQIVQPKPGPLPRRKSFAELTPTSLRLLAIKPGPTRGQLVLRVLNTTGRSSKAKLKLLGESLDLGSIRHGEIASRLLRRQKGRWTATPCDATK